MTCVIFYRIYSGLSINGINNFMSYENTPVESSNVASVAYDGKTRELDVTFKNGSTYKYSDVPKSVGDAFPYLESKGKGVHQLLRGTYAYKKL